jgi:hypothetical protein
MKQFTTSYKIVLFMIALLLFCPMGTGTITHAQAENDLDFVYGTNHYNGATYSSALVPEVVDTFYMLADNTNIVAARLTQIYYWQITNEYRADWDTANIIVEGTLEIVQGNKVLQAIDLTEYVIQFDGNNKIDTSVLYLGDEAIAARRNYETLQAQYRNDLQAYYKILNEYTALYQAALGQLQRGIISEDQLPASPIPLDDFSLFSTEVLFGFPVNLPVGDYDVRLRRPNGEIQPGSQKSLVVFDSLGEGIGYSVAGADRWNLAENTLSDSEVVYVLKDGIYFFEPVYQKLYNELYYTRLNNPQEKTARSDRNLWVPFRSAEDVSLEVEGQNGVQELSLKSFFVQQIFGSKLGFNIVPFDQQSMTKPTFIAFQVQTNDSLFYTIKLTDNNGEVLKGSEREIRVVNSGRTIMVYLISILPLFIGVSSVFSRKRKIRDIKVVGVG